MAAAPIKNDPEVSAHPDRAARLDHFKHALHRRMMALGLTQADVGRMAKVGRDSMSRYTRGMTLPDALTLQALARALGTSPTELDPGALKDRFIPAPANDAPGMTIRQSVMNPDRVRVQVDQELPFEAAAEIMMILKRHREAPASE
jgi:transcriptional regulator with XRE-family HTH domain